MAGVAFKKTFSYAGFEMQPKSYTNPKIALLNIELELKSEKENAELRIENVEVHAYRRVGNFQRGPIFPVLAATCQPVRIAICKIFLILENVDHVKFPAL